MEIYMKKVIIALGLALSVTGAVYADGNAFTPLNFNDTSFGKTVGSYAAQAANAIAEAEAIGNGNIQNAIAQLENAQVDIRNDLLKMKVDAIVNPTDYCLSGSASIDKRIHELGKEDLLNECKKFKHCDFGDAIITNAYNLDCKYKNVIINKKDKVLSLVFVYYSLIPLSLR